MRRTIPFLYLASHASHSNLDQARVYTYASVIVPLVTAPLDEDRRVSLSGAADSCKKTIVAGYSRRGRGTMSQGIVNCLLGRFWPLACTYTYHKRGRMYLKVISSATPVIVIRIVLEGQSCECMPLTRQTMADAPVDNL
ncbi:hypothetical protein BOTBODRAFT_501869 [Botryobasidium botryosum FD-172 SS1]|uniref:Uncharacterized protein n=1 Tax=Botryobasidium botryosum (strain FD-172 SS1) TaxID=930990 RepID=A0A067MEV0_BOTB1|nr:hypothetical protein BOTBODRAFT_501869 [Botryobasidium botryosum FD-172 SS1]